MPSYKTRVHSALGTTCFNSLSSLPILWCACSVSHSGADHLIYLSHVTAGKHYHYTHIMDRLSRDAGVLRAQNADEYRRLLPDREGLSVVRRRHAMPCHAVLTTKAPLSRSGPGQRSHSPQPGEIKEVWLSVSLGAVCHQPLSASGILLHERALQKDPQDVQCGM